MDGSAENPQETRLDRAWENGLGVATRIRMGVPSLKITNILILLTLLVVTACGRSASHNNNLTDDKGSRRCTMEYSPQRCTASRLKSGAALTPSISAEDANRCITVYALSDAAEARGFNLSDLDYSCEFLGF